MDSDREGTWAVTQDPITLTMALGIVLDIIRRRNDIGWTVGGQAFRQYTPRRQRQRDSGVPLNTSARPIRRVMVAGDYAGPSDD